MMEYDSIKKLGISHENKALKINKRYPNILVDVYIIDFAIH